MPGDFADFLRGLFAGAALAVPVGPVNLLALRRTLAHGWGSGVATGLGAGIADAICGAIAALGLRVLSDFLVAQQPWLETCGGLLLACIGLRTLRPAPATESAREPRPAHFHAALSSFLLTLTNPVTILAFGAVLGTLHGIDADSSWRGALPLVGGVFVGSMAWWLLLTGLVGRVRSRTRPRTVQRLSRASGALLALAGAALVVRALVSG